MDLANTLFKRYLKFFEKKIYEFTQILVNIGIKFLGFLTS